jgi:hypothetical protein
VIHRLFCCFYRPSPKTNGRLVIVKPVSLRSHAEIPLVDGAQCASAGRHLDDACLEATSRQAGSGFFHQMCCDFLRLCRENANPGEEA